MTTVEEISHAYPPASPRRLDRPRLGRGRHRAGAGGRRGAEGRQRPPGHGDEPGAAGIHAVPAADAPRPERHALAGPRPLRAVVRALQPDAVPPAVPGRLRAGALRHRVAAHLEVQDARPPGVPAHQGRGDHHRPAGPGAGLGGRHGDGVALRARPVRPGRRAGREPVRPLHLRHRLRRRHGGGRDQRRRRRWRAPSSWATSSCSTTTTRSPSSTTPTSRCARTSAAATAAYGWHVQDVEGGENVVGIEEAIAEAKAVTDKPSFIVGAHDHRLSRRRRR